MNNEPYISGDDDDFVCKEVRDNLKNAQVKRVKMLKRLAKLAVPIAEKYLCLLDTKDNVMICELLNDEISGLIIEQHMTESRANNVVNVAGIMLNELEDELQGGKKNNRN